VASADPDGYTLLCGNISTLVVLPAVSNNRDYDPSKAFAPIAKVSQNHEVLVVHPAFAAKSVPELVAYAQANPGKLNYGSAGHGNATHLAAELFKLRTGVDIVHVPYKGAADAVTGVLGGQVQISGISAACLRWCARERCAPWRCRAKRATRFSPMCPP